MIQQIKLSNYLTESSDLAEATAAFLLLTNRSAYNESIHILFLHVEREASVHEVSWLDDLKQAHFKIPEQHSHAEHCVAGLDEAVESLEDDLHLGTPPMTEDCE